MRVGSATVPASGGVLPEGDVPPSGQASPAKQSMAARRVGGDSARLPDSTIRVLTTWFEEHLLSERGP